MKKKSLVIGDIAKQLKVSITTVSFILNGRASEKRISEELTRRVLEYVKEVGYTPNHHAKSLRTGKTNLIGLIVEDISNPFFANIARLIEEIAYKKGFRIMYCSSENDTNKTRELIKVLRDRHVDAYIITPTSGIENDIETLLSNHASFVLFDRFFQGISTNYVVVDNATSSFNATQHLIDQGYKRIGFITVKSDQTQMLDRLSGYKKAIKANGLTSIVKKIAFQESSPRYVEDITSFLQKEAVEAVFFATNYLGISGLEAINIVGKKIPTDIGVVSFDDHDIFRLYTPSITTVAQPIKELSEQLIQVLLKDLEENQQGKKARQVVIPATLIVRNSSPKRLG